MSLSTVRMQFGFDSEILNQAGAQGEGSKVRGSIPGQLTLGGEIQPSVLVSERLKDIPAPKAIKKNTPSFASNHKLDVQA